MWICMGDWGLTKKVIIFIVIEQQSVAFSLHDYAIFLNSTSIHDISFTVLTKKCFLLEAFLTLLKRNTYDHHEAGFDTGKCKNEKKRYIFIHHYAVAYTRPIQSNVMFFSWIKADNIRACYKFLQHVGQYILSVER